MQLYIVRHAVTELNGKGYLATKQDPGLTSEGIKECEKMRYSEGDFDNVYCSPYKRTIQTAKLLYPYKEPIVTELITQRDFGSLSEHFKEEYSEEFLEKLRNYKIDREDLEDISEIMHRLFKFFEMVAENNDEQSSILVVTHNGIMRVIRKQFLFGTKYEEERNLKGFSMQLEKKRGIK